MSESSIFLVVFFVYFMGLVMYFAHFETQNEPILVLAKKTVVAGLFLHAGFLLGLGFRPGGLSMVSLVEFGAPFGLLFLSYLLESRRRVKLLMLFSLPLGLLLSMFAILHSRQTLVLSQDAASGWLWLHLGFIFGGLAALVLAVSSAVMYLLQSAQLKSKRPGRTLLALPALDTLDRIHFRSLAGGVVFFSIGILSGFFSVKNISELGAAFRDPKIFLSFLTCLLYWGVLSLRLSALRRGKKIAIGTVLVFVLLVGTLLSSYYAPSAFHRGF